MLENLFAGYTQYLAGDVPDTDWGLRVTPVRLCRSWQDLLQAESNCDVNCGLCNVLQIPDACLFNVISPRAEAIFSIS